MLKHKCGFYIWTAAHIIQVMTQPEFVKIFDPKLRYFFLKKRREAVYLGSLNIQIIEQIESVTLRGGDRLRPYCCWLGYQAGQGVSMTAIMPALIALEIHHSFALIHDDIMDEAEMRRGGLTIHAHFTQNLRKHTLAKSLAMLAGDYCSVWADKAFDDVNSPYVFEAKKLYYQMREELIAGQLLDIVETKTPSLKEIYAMYRMKSGNYTIQKPLLIGLALAEHKPTHIVLTKTLSEYGERLGLAFQLKDDLLGIFGEVGKTGKPNDNDIKNGKWTAPLTQAYTSFSIRDQKQFAKIFGHPEAKAADIEYCRQLIVDAGARKMTEVTIARLVAQAIRIINKAPILQVELFVSLAHSMVRREA